MTNQTIQDIRVLPSPSDDAAWTAEQFNAIAFYGEQTVCPEAHKLAHPNPIHDCPWCPPAQGEAPDRSSETYWRQVAA